MLFRITEVSKELGINLFVKSNTTTPTPFIER